MQHNSSYFRNIDCKYFPCHKVKDTDNFNCLFCFCPLYTTACSGNFNILSNGIKDCSNCTVPHKAENYNKIINQIISVNDGV